MGKDATLRQAFVSFHLKSNKTISETEIATSSTDFYNCHDIAHVVFNCDTSFQGEAMVKLWTIFGTTLGFAGHFKEYAKANAFEMFRRYSLKHILKNIFKILAVAPVVIIRASKMKKKWPWSSYEKYLDMPISEIRKEFNINPVTT